MNGNSMIEYGYRRLIITLTAMICAILELLDTTIVNVALNDLQGNLGATLSEVGWVVTAYGIGNVIIIPMTGWLSRQFGRRNYFTGSIIMFTVFSFLCGQAGSIWTLACFRFFQGMGGGALLATSQTVITESYPPEKRGVSHLIFMMGVIIGPALGPLIGGYIVDNYSWPFIFYINIPLGILAALLSMQFIRSPRYGDKLPASKVDWLGILLLAASVGSLQYVLEKGQEEDWFNDKTIRNLSVVAFFGLILFVWREITYRHPIVAVRTLKNRNLAAGTLFSFIYGFGSYGSTFIVPLFTQSQLGWPATDAGLLVCLTSLSSLLIFPLTSWLLKTGIKPQIIMACGMVLFFFNCYMSAGILTPDTGFPVFFYVLVFRYFGLNMILLSISAIAFSSLKTHEIAEGAAFTGMIRQLGGSFGIAIITTFITRRNAQHRMDLVTHLDTNDPLVWERLHQSQQAFMAKGFTPDHAMRSGLQLMEHAVNKQATLLSYMDVYFTIGFLFLACAPIVLMLKAGKKNAITDAH
ncbi:DHA2 family multidrug resistance protein [Chitinophaga terrae (ex Kim and Jung 2007)]|uniref:DHA2 family efflux MFS transporter permease subunit n=1 Tax=Chitinophaga terrae (ex Kim and Jung 2007) TaxID=408074 RepID=UPI002783B01A|nr:DHA2 family efflux MFS transporter permease subunit [Chitinophaga terrae (ex Kim and Jung 2007)]MDQ0106772.1 DHA2 family multidrug resistance protein [Chitinophaga terrae (ex Kim and Jung 2007)]